MPVPIIIMDNLKHLKDFLDHDVEGYLFGDLKCMKAIPICYPLLMSTFAGIELLGALLSERRFKLKDGIHHFLSYWESELYPAPCNFKKAGEALYKLVRHGIAHSFVPKGPLVFVRNQPSLHLKSEVLAGDFESIRVYVDAVRLADDFIASYWDRVKPRAAGNGAEALRMAKRLDEMADAYQKQADELHLDAIFEPTSIAEAGDFSDSALI